MKQFTIFRRISAGKLSLCCFLLLILPISSSAELVDRIVAIVNDQIITLSELDEEAAGLYSLIARKSNGGALLEELAHAREITLNNMIDKSLIYQKAAEQNVSVSDEEVQRAFDSMLSKSKLSKDAFLQKLEESGMTERMYRSKLRTQILQSKLVSIDVRSRIIITDEMILDYYDEHYTSRVAKGSYYLLQIGFTWNPNLENSVEIQKSKNAAKQRAERVHRLAESGQDFSTLAKKFSDLPSAADGGDIGVFTLDDMAPAMRDAITSVPTGHVSKVIELSSGFQFFKVLSGKEDAIVVTAPLETVKEEIRDKLFQAELQKEFEVWVDKLRNTTYIKKL